MVGAVGWKRGEAGEQEQDGSSYWMESYWRKSGTYDADGDAAGMQRGCRQVMCGWEELSIRHVGVRGIDNVYDVEGCLYVGCWFEWARVQS